MKKYIKILVFICLMCVLSGCTKDYKKYDIKKYVKNELGLTKFTVSNSYVPVRDYEGRTDRYWTVHDDLNDITFFVFDNYYYDSEDNFNELLNNYYSAYYLKNEKSINKNNNLTYEKLVTKEYPDYYEIELYCSYTSKSELEKCYNSAKYVNDYFKGKEEFHYEFTYNYPNRSKKTSSINADYGGVFSKIIDEGKDLYFDYFYYGIVYNVNSILKEMTPAEYNSVINGIDAYKIYKEDSTGNKIKEYENIYGYGLGVSCNGLYNILKEEGYEVTGTPNNFKVSYNNKIYEFSDEFLKYNSYRGFDTYYYVVTNLYPNYSYEEDASLTGKTEKIIDFNIIEKVFNLKLNSECERYKKN